MSSIILLLALTLLTSLSSHALTQAGCGVKHAYYNIVCSRFEFWCTTRRNVLTYEAVCKNITLGAKQPLSLDNSGKIFDIEIYSSDIVTLSAGMFVDYPNMQRLYIQSGNTKEIQADAFKGASKLDWLIAKNNNISTIQPKAFSGLGKLNVLNLNLNVLTELKDYTFEGLESLQYLSLKENKISFIQDNTFTQMKKLGVLFLNDNLLTEVSDKLLVNNVGLRLVWFQNNRVKSFPNNFFKNKPLLNEVILDNNKLDRVDYDRFNGNLSMNHNNIKQLLPLGVLSTDYFDISYNLISFIPDNAFAFSSNMNTLLLNNNSINVISKDAFRNLTKLKALRLDSNQINSLELGLFQDLKQLITLNLSYNQIQHIESGTFTGLISLENLDLSYNKISFMQISALYTLKLLKTFYFNDNSLQKIDFDNLVLHLASLQEINLDNNLWACEGLSVNLLRLDLKKIKIVHGSNLNTANVHGISCTDADFKSTESSKLASLTPEYLDIQTQTTKFVIKDKTPEKALHSTSEKSSSGPGKEIHILTGFGVFLFIAIVYLVVKRYFWKHKIVVRRVESSETVSYKLDLEE